MLTPFIENQRWNPIDRGTRPRLSRCATFVQGDTVRVVVEGDELGFASG